MSLVHETHFHNFFVIFIQIGGLHPLHNACSFGHVDVVRLLLEAGAAPNTTDNWNYTPLHEAAQKGKVDVCIGMYAVREACTLSR